MPVCKSKLFNTKVPRRKGGKKKNRKHGNEKHNRKSQMSDKRSHKNVNLGVEYTSRVNC